MSAPRIVRRKCPDCGALLIASSGVAWMPCSACAVAVNLFTTPVARIRCRRVRREGELVLPFYRFRTASEERWFPAFRNAGKDGYTMAAALARKASALEFTDGPCDVALGRGVEEARALAESAGEVELIAVPCSVHGDVVTEPLTGTTLRGWTIHEENEKRNAESPSSRAGERR